VICTQAQSRLPPSMLFSDRDFTADDYEALLALDEGIDNRKGVPFSHVSARKAQGSKLMFSHAHLRSYADGKAPGVPQRWLLPMPMHSAELSPVRHAGASKEVIEAIPTVTVGGKGGGLAPDDDPRCCICLADYAPGATLRKLPCSHQFHKCAACHHSSLLQSSFLPLLPCGCR
jgi:RING-like zinc finger